MEFFNTLLINKKDLIHNIKVLKEINKEKKICAMVKANAYGHGLENAVLSLKKYVDFFGVANSTEALLVRKLSKQKSILLCGAFSKESLKELILNDISLTVYNKTQLNLIIKQSKRLETKAKIHLKINTGMNRLGIKKKGYFKELLKSIELNKDYIILEGIYSHFFASDCSKALTEKQYYKFIEYLSIVKNKEGIIIHIENSAGYILKADKFNICNMARLGLSLYGYNPTDKYLNLKRVLTLKSKIIDIQKVNKGEYIGYGNRYVANKKLKIGVLPIGYYDGLLRKLCGYYVLVNNTPCKILSVCMDMILIDVSKANAKINDIVIIIGNENKSVVDANLMADVMNTICYEVLTNIKHERLNIEYLN